MIQLRKRLDSLEAFNAAISGFQHLPHETLTKFILAHYTVDLDVMSTFLQEDCKAETAVTAHEPAKQVAA
ncbi:hypothetical protein [Roseibium algae]|uniref:Uncharacterized protein n=1 Tax=Roseibium algae TaxID=3123038 RepID=A0ABU8TGN8_9HYPH